MARSKKPATVFVSHDLFGPVAQCVDAVPTQTAVTSPAVFDESAIAALANEDLLALFSMIGAAVSQRCLVKRPYLSSWSTVLEYLRSAIGFESREQFRVLFLDKRNCLIADECLGHGTVDHVPVYPREVARRAIELQACALILVHNHPSGDTTPSHADIQMTVTLQDGLKLLGITIHDHIIIGRNEHTSLKAKNLI